MSFFPTRIRYTGIAITYNIGFAIAEAVTPVTFTWITHSTNTQLGSIYCFISVFVVAIIAGGLIPVTKKDLIY
jgi:MHS family proline/betaine transporter-like MFS transporter